MLIKMDHKVMWLLSEDREDVVAQLTNSFRMYSWVKDEDIGDTIDSFALANQKATIGDLIEWTKRTYAVRLEAVRAGKKLDSYRLEGDYNPTAGARIGAKEEFGQHGASSTVPDYVPPVRKAVQRTDLKQVAKPGEEGPTDAADNAALADEATDNPLTPPAGISSVPGIEEGQRPDSPDLTPLQQRGLAPKK